MGLAGRYRIEISSEGIVAVVDSDDRLDVARSLYWHAVMNHRPGWCCCVTEIALSPAAIINKCRSGGSRRSPAHNGEYR
jgi:hypothetical protein